MAGNPFDALKRNIVNIVEATMGFDVSWTPSTGGTAKTGKALYNAPSRKVEGWKYRDEYGKINYDPTQHHLEFKVNLFDGLREACDSGETETISIVFSDSLTTNFRVMKVHKLWDGDTFIAVIDPIES